MGSSFLHIFFLSIDEIFRVHERLNVVIRKTFELSGYFYWSWIIPYGIGVIIIGLVYIPFLKKLPKKVMLLFIFAGFLFVSGALGLEAIGGKQFETYGNNNNTYFLFYTFEEFLEMAGICIFLYALLKHISGENSSKIATINTGLL